MRILHALTGSVTFSVIGAFTEQFISELIESGINIGCIENKSNIVYVNAKRTDYKRISIVAKKHRVHIKAVKRHGLFFKIKKLKTHSGIVFGAAAAIFILLIMQNFVWKIEIHGAETVSENLIMKTISDSGINLGELCSKIDTEGAEIKLKNVIKELSWTNVEIDGCKVEIFVKEAKNVKKSEIPIKIPCNVVADKSGVILETEVYAGTLMHRKGSGISEGSVIVSGLVNDGSDNIILTHANAKIIAEFTEKVEFRQDYNTMEKYKNGVTETEKELMLFGFVIPLSKRITDTENKICNENIKKCFILGFEMPWKIKENIYEEYENISVTRSNEDVIKLLEQKLEIYCDNVYSQYEIIDIFKMTTADDDGLTLSAKIKLKGNIARLSRIFDKNA